MDLSSGSPSSALEVSATSTPPDREKLLPTLFTARVDWKYDFKREFQEIVSRVFLGPLSSAKDLGLLRSTGITDIIIVRSSKETHFLRPRFPESFKYQILECGSSEYENMKPLMYCIKELIDEVLNKGGKVLIHGNAGMCRSAVLVVAYVMVTFDMTNRMAESYVLGRRGCLCIPDAFRHQLREFDVLYRCRISETSAQSSGISSRKRPRVEAD